MRHSDKKENAGREGEKGKKRKEKQRERKRELLPKSKLFNGKYQLWSPKFSRLNFFLYI